MNCPKCGAAQSAGREDCSACGIVFARWQPRAPRKPTLSAPVEPEEKTLKIPVPFIIVAFFFVIVGGLIWTKHSKEARAKMNPDDILNDINNKGTALRNDLRKTVDANVRAQNRAAAEAAAKAAAINSKLPDDLDETRIASLIERCSYFEERVTVDIPKKFQVNIFGFTIHDYPAITRAAVDHLIEFDPPSFNPSAAARYLPNPAQPGETVTVKLTSDANKKVDVTEDEKVYHFGLGRRRLEITRAGRMTDSTAFANFKWGFDNDGGANLAPEGTQRTGGADLQRGPGGWSVLRMWQTVWNGSNGIICR